VTGFWAGMFGALVYSILTWAFSTLLPRQAQPPRG
jgi:uncharacterized membrane protein YvlD (DUF360 family)